MSGLFALAESWRRFRLNVFAMQVIAPSAQGRIHRQPDFEALLRGFREDAVRDSARDLVLHYTETGPELTADEERRAWAGIRQ